MGGLSGQSLTGLSSIIVKRPVLWPPNQGKIEERSANQPILLNDPQDVFIVEGGAVDVFSAPPVKARTNGEARGKANGHAPPPPQERGARRYLWTSGEGDVLFGFDA